MPNDAETQQLLRSDPVPPRPRGYYTLYISQEWTSGTAWISSVVAPTIQANAPAFVSQAQQDAPALPVRKRPAVPTGYGVAEQSWVPFAVVVMPTPPFTGIEAQARQEPYVAGKPRTPALLSSFGGAMDVAAPFAAVTTILGQTWPAVQQLAQEIRFPVKPSPLSTTYSMPAGDGWMTQPLVLAVSTYLPAIEALMRYDGPLMNRSREEARRQFIVLSESFAQTSGTMAAAEGFFFKAMPLVRGATVVPNIALLGWFSSP